MKIIQLDNHAPYKILYYLPDTRSLAPLISALILTKF